MTELHLFAGAGGGILGGILLQHTCVCAVEIEPYCRRVLLQRQRDGILPRFPIWDDVRTFDGKPWRGKVDIVCGGFPCQDISAAGKGAGIEGKRSGLWSEMARIVGQVRPQFVFVENSPLLVGRGLAVVLGDLASMGYDARWCVLGAVDAGAPHRRKRIWILAHAEGVKRRTGLRESGTREEAEPQHKPESCDGCRDDAKTESGGFTKLRGAPGESGHADQLRETVPNSNGPRLEERQSESGNDGKELKTAIRADWWQSEPDVGRVANGVASRADRLTAIGNGQVPAVAALAWNTLTADLP